MVGERRAPGVQHGGEADARAQMLRVGGEGGQRLGGGREQEVVDGGLILERDGADRGRQGEDDVIIRNRQERFRFVLERWRWLPATRASGHGVRAFAPIELAELCRRMMLEAYGPAGVLINRKLECLYYRARGSLSQGRTGPPGQ